MWWEVVCAWWKLVASDGCLADLPDAVPLAAAAVPTMIRTSRLWIGMQSPRRERSSSCLQGYARSVLARPRGCRTLHSLEAQLSVLEKFKVGAPVPIQTVNIIMRS